MRKRILFLIIIYFALFNLSNSSSLTIERSRAHEDKSGNYTPLVVTLSTEDVKNKTKPVDLICIVDVSLSMGGNKIELVRDSLEYIVNISNSTDKLALVKFSSNSQIVHNLTEMTEKNKALFLKSIKNLTEYGGTNILSGLEKGLELLTHDYSSGDRIASMVLLSDGEDNYYEGVELANLFRDLMSNESKSDYIFTLHTFGYGYYYDYVMLNEIASIKDGAFFHISELKDVDIAYLKIYGFLSTVMDVNVTWIIDSKFNITNVYGMDGMYDAYIKIDTRSEFGLTIIQVGFGKTYAYVLELDIPESTPDGTEVLEADIPRLKLNKKYFWSNNYSPTAYEEYIKCIVVVIFMEGYELSKSVNTSAGVAALDKGIIWINKNYKGTKNWIKELNDAKKDLNSIIGISGKANLLSKITELKTPKVGIHYDPGNSYQRALIENFYGLDISKMELIQIKGQKIINYIQNINYYYFYLKGGNGEINGVPFSGEKSSFIIYSPDTSGNINITSISNNMECYFSNKTINNITAIVDFNHIGKFIYKKDFPFYFYTIVDGKKDITYNIEFFNLNENIDIEKELDILAYVLSDDVINNLEGNKNSLETFESFSGIFNNNIKMGKIIIKKDDITRKLNNIYNNYLYIAIKKKSGSKISISEIKGQFYFIPNNYIYSPIPGNYKIFSHLEKGDTPHLYTLEIDPSLENNLFQIEIDNLGNNELDFKILNYQNYIDGLIDLYNDYNGFIIDKKNISDKIYLNVTQNVTNLTLDKIILSVFSKNKDHMPSSNLPYLFKYNSQSSQKAILIIKKIKVTILGFAKYTYNKANKKINFLMYFVYVETTHYVKKIAINAFIKYKGGKRMLQQETKKGECNIEESYSNNNQKRYQCFIDTNGEEIDNIQIDKNIKSEDDDIDLTETKVSPMGVKYMNNIQEIGNEDPFNKKLYLLETTSINVDNDNNEFNITGVINGGTDFNYKKINLEISLIENSVEKLSNVSCIPTKKETIYNLQCNTNNEMSGVLNSGFSNLGNENLIVEISDSVKKSINFKEKIEKMNRNYNKSSGGLSTGVIIAIVIPIVIILIATVSLAIFCFNKKRVESPNQGDSSIVPNNSALNINQNV